MSFVSLSGWRQLRRRIMDEVTGFRTANASPGTLSSNVRLLQPYLVPLRGGVVLTDPFFQPPRRACPSPSLMADHDCRPHLNYVCVHVQACRRPRFSAQLSSSASSSGEAFFPLRTFLAGFASRLASFGSGLIGKS